MNRPVLEKLYVLKYNLSNQLEANIERGKLPMSADTADVDSAVRKQEYLSKSEQLTMVKSLIDLMWEPENA